MCTEHARIYSELRDLIPLPSSSSDKQFVEEKYLSYWPSAGSSNTLRKEDEEKGSERPKVVIRNDRLRVFLYFLLFHAIPL